jgi:uncharacterized membrane protein YhaH (DUF805 family)
MGDLGATMGLLSFYFLPAGRIGRARFWLGWFGLILIGSLFNYWLVASLFGRDPFDPATGGLAKPALQLALLSNVIFMFPLFVLLAKRFHDRGKGAIWTLPFLGAYAAAIAVLIPGDFKPEQATALQAGLMALYLVLLIWIVVELGCLKGTAGPNAYGPDPVARKA